MGRAQKEPGTQSSAEWTIGKSERGRESGSAHSRTQAVVWSEREKGKKFKFPTQIHNRIHAERKIKLFRPTKTGWVPLFGGRWVWTEHSSKGYFQAPLAFRALVPGSGSRSRRRLPSRAAARKKPPRFLLTEGHSRWARTKTTQFLEGLERLNTAQLAKSLHDKSRNKNRSKIIHDSLMEVSWSWDLKVNLELSFGVIFGINLS